MDIPVDDEDTLSAGLLRNSGSNARVIDEAPSAHLFAKAFHATEMPPGNTLAQMQRFASLQMPCRHGGRQAATS